MKDQSFTTLISGPQTEAEPSLTTIKRVREEVIAEVPEMDAPGKAHHLGVVGSPNDPGESDRPTNRLDRAQVLESLTARFWCGRRGALAQWHISGSW